MKLDAVEKLFRKKRNDLPCEFWANCVEHVKKVEQSYRESDKIQDVQVEKSVIALKGNDSSYSDSETSLRVILTKGRHFRMGKKISDFKLLILELFKLYHQSLKLKFLKYAAQEMTDFEPIFAQSLCPDINVTFVMVVQKYLINRYFFSKYKNPIYFFLSQLLIRKADLFIIS